MRFTFVPLIQAMIDKKNHLDRTFLLDHRPGAVEELVTTEDGGRWC